MTKLMYVLTILFIVSLASTSCKKKDSGVCYCTYYKGDDKEFNLNHLPRSQQIDSCYLTSQNASHFGGSCELE